MAFDGKILLTGATGFVGSACLRALVRRGAQVAAVNRTGCGPALERVTWHAVDLRDGAAAERLIGEVRPSHVLHVAWMSTPGVYPTSPENLDWLAAGLALARAFGRAGGRRFVGVGTCAEYDWSSSRFVEDETPLRPASLYGRCKVAMWDCVQACAAAHGFSAAWARLFLPYGPGDAAKRLIPSVVAALREGRPVATTEGLQERDFVFVDDIGELLAEMAQGEQGGAFNIGTGIATQVRRAIEILVAQIGNRSAIHHGAVPLPAHEPKRLIADMTKVNKTFGWTAPTTLEAGLCAYLNAANRIEIS